MIDSGKDIHCYGCGVCEISCPVDIIKMEISDEGFWVPIIVEKTKCIECGICEKICSHLYDTVLIPEDILEKGEGYAVHNRSSEIRKNSTSGGIGIEIARAFIDEGYKSIGVKYNYETNSAEHFIADNIDDYEISKGSKYVQSNTIPGFSKINFNEKNIVFGTPCQIDSLRRLAKHKRREDNFVFIDFFCHGVPSYHMWNKYIDMVKKQLKTHTFSNIVFRDKRFGWHAFTISLEAGSKEYIGKLKNNDYFYNFFLGNYCLNKSCLTCKFRLSNASSDLRFGDFWGTEYASNNEGISCVYVKTDKGKTIVDKISTSCVVKDATLDSMFEEQMHGNVLDKPRRRKLIDDLTISKSIGSIYRKYALKSIVKNMLPIKLKNILKQLIKNRIFT